MACTVVIILDGVENGEFDKLFSFSQIWLTITKSKAISLMEVRGRKQLWGHWRHLGMSTSLTYSLDFWIDSGGWQSPLGWSKELLNAFERLKSIVAADTALMERQVAVLEWLGTPSSSSPALITGSCWAGRRPWDLKDPRALGAISEA